MSVAALTRRVARVAEAVQEPLARLEDWHRVVDAKVVVLERFMDAIPASRDEVVATVLEPHPRALITPHAGVEREAPSLVRWLVALDFPGGWFPDPVPEALIDAFLAHPAAAVWGYDCAGCGVMAPYSDGPGDYGPVVVHLTGCPSLDPRGWTWRGRGRTWCRSWPLGWQGSGREG